MHIERGIESGKPTEENPMSENMLTARTMTFGAHWPHEDKRGWICKTQKVTLDLYGTSIIAERYFLDGLCWMVLLSHTRK